MVQTMKPEVLNTEFENISRWEDDGGTIFRIDDSAHHSEKDKRMGKKVGLWINRNKAVIVTIANKIEGRSIITSDMEHYILYTTVVPGDGSPEEIRDRRFWNHLGEYYEKITEHVRDAVEIQIFGPDDAKFELQKHLESKGLADRIVSIENAGTLTDSQIAIKVRKRFPARSQFDIF
jgi:hypothetical protein